MPGLFKGQTAMNARVDGDGVVRRIGPLGSGAGNSKILLLGGFKDPTAAREYDPKADSWRTLPSLSNNHQQTAGAYSDGNGTVYLAGSQDGQSGDDKLQIFDLETESWSTVSMPTGVTAPTAGVLDGSFHLFCGLTDGSGSISQTRRIVLRYDGGGSWTRRTDAPENHNRASGSAIGGKQYVMGDNDNYYGNAQSLLEYDAAADSWTSKANVPFAIDEHSDAATLDGKLYIAHDKSIAVYDPVKDSWDDSLTDPPRDVYGRATAAADGKIVTFGGQKSPTDDGDPKVTIYDPKSDSWSSGTKIPTGGTAFATAVGVP